MQELNDFFDAAEKGNLEILGSFLAKGISVNATNYYNETVLIAAVIKKQKDIVTYLLKRDDVKLSIAGITTGTALTFAIFDGQTETANALLDKEKLFKSTDHPGAVNWAIWQNNKEILEKMLTKGADFNQAGLVDLEEDEKSEWAWKPDPDPKETPFHRSYFPQLRYTPLYLSILKKNYQIMEFLLKEGRVDPNKANVDGSSPLQLAIRLNDEKAVEILLKYNANPEFQESEQDKNIPSFLRKGKIEPSVTIKEMIAKSKSSSSQQSQMSSPFWEVSSEKKYKPLLPIESQVINHLKLDSNIWKSLLQDPDILKNIIQAIKEESLKMVI